MVQGPLETSIDIGATPDVVWDAVSDLRAMERNSPELLRTWMRGKPKVGRRALNLNRRKAMIWPTRSRITQWKPPALDSGHGALAFEVMPTDVVWSYELEPTATGTRLTERRTALVQPSTVVRLTARWALGGAENHDIELLAGMEETLTKIKAELET